MNSEEPCIYGRIVHVPKRPKDRNPPDGDKEGNLHRPCVHVEMLKANPEEAVYLLTNQWKVVWKTVRVPLRWLRGVIVPLFKVKGEQMDPGNSKPLSTLSHARKLVEKAVITELDRKIGTDRAQYGFQAGI